MSRSRSLALPRRVATYACSRLSLRAHAPIHLIVCMPSFYPSSSLINPRDAPIDVLMVELMMEKRTVNL